MNKWMKYLNTSVIAMVSGVIASPGAQAGQGNAGGPPAFGEFDKDGSGFVTESEFNSTRAQRMAARAAEGKQLRGAASAPAFSEIDTDGDGLLSLDELSTAQKTHMKQRHSMNQHAPGRKGNGKSRGKGHGKGYGRKMKGNMPVFSDFDIDNDGKILESEFNQAHAKRMQEMASAGYKMKHTGDAPGFSGIDTNKDGEISKQEFATHQSEHHERMHQVNNQEY
jgi:Ca2+-binding EF-hand superfamily protein